MTKKSKASAKPKPIKAKRGSMQHVLSNMDKFVTSKHSDIGLHEFNLAHYELEIDGGWVRLKMKSSTAKKLKL